MREIEVALPRFTDLCRSPVVRGTKVLVQELSWPATTPEESWRAYATGADSKLVQIAVAPTKEQLLAKLPASCPEVYVLTQ